MTTALNTADRLSIVIDETVDAVLNRRGMSLQAYLLLPPPSAGFMVAARPDAELIVDPDDKEAARDAVENWLREHYRDARRHGLYIGVWIMDDGRACLDLSEHWHTREPALRVGRHRDQKAIWDLAASAAIAC